MNVLMTNGQVLKSLGIGTIELKIDDMNPVKFTVLVVKLWIRPDQEDGCKDLECSLEID